MKERNPLRRLALGVGLSALALTATACSDDDDDDGGGGGPPPPGTASANLLVGDATVEDLLSFTATIDSAVLVDPVGGETDNFLESPVTLELLGLGSGVEWAGTESFDADLYDAVRLTFSGVYEAAAKDGTSVTVVPVGPNTLDVPFTGGTATLGDGDLVNVVVDIDLSQSLSGDVGTGTINFTPTATAEVSTAPVVIDDVRGTVLPEEDEASGTFVLQAAPDQDGAPTIATITVDVTGATLLLGEDGNAFADPTAFFAGLDAGDEVEVEGSLSPTGTPPGVILADRVDVETPGAVAVILDGIVLDFDDTLNTFDLLITNVEKGQALVDIAAPDQAVVTVSYDDSVTSPFVGDDHVLTDDTALATGKHVEVEFSDFTASPFPASQIEIETAAPRFNGVVADVTDVGSTPASFLMNLDANEPAILAGAVDDELTDVSVESIETATVSLDDEAGTALTLDDLAVGQEVSIRGDLSGTSAAPILDATEIVVEGGALEGATADLPPVEGTQTFVTTDGTIVEAFSDALVEGPAPPLTVEVLAGTAFTGDATSLAEFLALFPPAKGDTVVVDVRGFARSADTIAATEVDVDVQTAAPPPPPESATE